MSTLQFTTRNYYNNCLSVDCQHFFLHEVVKMVEFNPELARKYGLVEAIIFERLKLLQEKNIINCQNYYDNTYWVDMNDKVYSNFFYFLPNKDIEFALENLKKREVLKTLKIGDRELYSIYDKYVKVIYNNK